MTMYYHRLACAFLLLIASFPFAGQSQNAHATATITINNLDGPGEGFNSTAPPDVASTAGGNPGATLGQQRLLSFQFAADIWSGIIDSDVPIVVDAALNPQTCSPFTGTLGSAGPEIVVRDFNNAPVANTWFSIAQANSLAGLGDLDPGFPEIVATFNSDVDDNPNCLTGFTWYYGFDGAPPLGQIDFTTVVLHEIAHGLGFLSLVNLSNGTKFLGLDDAYMRHLANGTTGEAFPDMNNGERRNAMRSVDNLVWTGNAVNTNETLSSGKHAISDQVLMYAPNPIEPGSSVSHFDTTLDPDELMEPFNTGVTTVGLTDDLFEDIGWGVSGCGDTILDPGEDCDEGGETATCDVNCTSVACGDGTLNTTAGEECDDGNTDSGDGCSDSCILEFCGDGLIQAGLGETCDDSGESATCDNNCTGALCGDGTLNITAGEGCDDGNNDPGDGCSPTCVLICGNGTLDGTEECDDNNTDSGDGCSSSCELETCFSCVGTNCTAEPQTGCRVPTESNRAIIIINDKSNDNADNLTWRWIRGEATTLADFGDPLTDTDYELCIFDETGDVPSLVFSAEAPAGGTCRNNDCWRATGSNGFRYQDLDRTPDGINTIVLRRGDEGKALVSVVGRGPNLTLPTLPMSQDSTVTAQLRNSNGVCWEEEYSTALRNTDTQFRAKGD